MPFQLTNQNVDLQQQLDDLQLLVEANRQQKQISQSQSSDFAVEREQYQKQILELQNELSTIIAEKVETEDMRNVYIDELNCLRVNLTATEELYKNATAEIAVLKSQNATANQQLKENENRLKAQQEEIDVIKAQVISCAHCAKTSVDMKFIYF